MDTIHLLKDTVVRIHTVHMPVSWDAPFVQSGTGQVTVEGGSGVTLNTQGGVGARKTRYQHQIASVYKTAADTWMITGDLVVP